MSATTTSFAAKELASLIRGYHAGQRIDKTAMLQSLAKMLTGEANTAADALALLVAARALMAFPVSQVPPIEESQEGLAVHCVNELIGKAIGALEIASGENRAIYMGALPALN